MSIQIKLPKFSRNKSLNKDFSKVREMSKSLFLNKTNKSQNLSRVKFYDSYIVNTDPNTMNYSLDFKLGNKTTSELSQIDVVRQESFVNYMLKYLKYNVHGIQVLLEEADKRKMFKLKNCMIIVFCNYSIATQRHIDIGAKEDRRVINKSMDMRAQLAVDSDVLIKMNKVKLNKSRIYWGNLQPYSFQVWFKESKKNIGISKKTSDRPIGSLSNNFVTIILKDESIYFLINFE